MKKEELVKKWMKEVYLDELNHHAMIEELLNQGEFYYWDKNDPRLKQFNSLERQMKRRKNRIYTHFGFKMGKVWMCEADHKITRLLHSFCHDPETLYEMFRIRAEMMLKKDALTLRGWLMEARQNGTSIYDVPDVLYRFPQGWSKYIYFVWNAFKVDKFKLEDLVEELLKVKDVSRRMRYEPVCCDDKLSKKVVDQLRFLPRFIEILPTARQAHEISEEKRRVLFEKNGMEFRKCEFDDGI
jgi:hypothetical protein